MSFRREIKFRRSAPPPCFDIVIRTMADGNACVRQIWNAGHDLAEPRIQIACGLLQFGNLLAQFLRLRHGGARVLPRLLQLANLFRSLVALSLGGFHLGNGLTPLRIYLAEVLEYGSRIHAALAQLLLYQWQVVTNKV